MAELVAAQTVYVPKSHKWFSFLSANLQDVRVVTDDNMPAEGADFYLEPGLDIAVPELSVIIKEFQESEPARRVRYLRAGNIISAADDDILGPSPWFPSLGRLKATPLPILWQTVTPRYDLCVICMQVNRELQAFVDNLRNDGIHACGPFELASNPVQHIQISKFSMLYHGRYGPTPLGPEFTTLATLCAPMLVDFPLGEEDSEPLPNVANLLTDVITYDPRDLSRLTAKIHGLIYRWPLRMLSSLPLAYELLRYSVFAPVSSGGLVL